MKKFIVILLVLFSKSIFSQVPPPALLPNEYWTELYSAAYDYQTNGSLRYIVQDPVNPLNLCAVLMATEDSNQTSQRLVYYSYSFDGGQLWAKAPVNNIFGSGFPSLTLRNNNPVIALHAGAGSIVYEDVVFGGFFFKQVGTLPGGVQPIWPQVSGTSNGNIVLAGSPATNFTGYRSIYNGTTWLNWEQMSNIGGPAGNFSIASGSNGIVYIFGINFDINDAVYYYKSTDNGITFDNGNLVLTSIPDGGDNLFNFIECGRQAVIKNTEPHLVFGVYSNNSINIGTNVNYFIKSRIYHWSPSTGINLIAGRSNIPNLADTITQSLVTPVCQPSIGILNNGTLICTFTAYLWNNKQPVQNGELVNAGEIFITKSNDNGLTWTTPVNITSTPALEEKHSSLIPHSFNDSVGVYYLRDMKAGAWVNINAWGKAPVYGIFRKGLDILLGNNTVTNVLPVKFELYQNFPNPFNPVTTIKFDVVKSGFYTLEVYNVLGKKVDEIISKEYNAGSYEVIYNAEKLSSGVYYYSLKGNEGLLTRKFLLLK